MKKKSNITKKTIIGIWGYFISSVILLVAALAVIPDMMTKISGIINKNLTKAINAKKNDDDWGPIIEKK